MSSIADNYEINVAKKKNADDKYGVHFCKIQLSSDVMEEEAEEKLDFFRNLFGNEYHVSMTHWICRGTCKDFWR